MARFLGSDLQIFIKWKNIFLELFIKNGPNTVIAALEIFGEKFLHFCTSFEMNILVLVVPGIQNEETLLSQDFQGHSERRNSIKLIESETTKKI